MKLAVAGAYLDGFSGIPRHLSAALGATTRWDLVEYQPALVERARARATPGQYLWEKSPARCTFLSRQIDERAQREPVDAILVFGSESCAFCETRVPLYGFGDSIFGTRIDLYADQEGALSKRSVREGIDVQQRALEKLRVLFMTSQWAIDRAVEVFGYRVEPAKVDVTLVGANLPHIDAVPPIRTTPLRLAWVGVDWKRKQGDLAVAIVRTLRERGVDGRLDVAGPVSVEPAGEWMSVHGRLAATALTEVYANASALLLPTKADLTPIVIAEAAMMGRATFASPIGGIPEMILQGENGVLIDSDDPNLWADAMQHADLARLGAAARRAYEERLNWRGIANRMRARMEER
ncbi:MAG: glycosyltransferase family 4 protein [Acidobacteriota bacterium]|nr:glycosyltransferase family 4 protein [Acidobacteriota bacterium]